MSKYSALQTQILKGLYASGMTSGKASDMVSQAVLNTGLTKDQVINWIHNQKKPNRGKRALSTRHTQYSAFLATCKDIDFDGSGDSLGTLAKKKGALYRSHMATPEGREFLRKNHEKLHNPETKPDAQRLIMGCYKRLKEQCDHLESLGCHVGVMVAEPGKSVLVFGTPSAGRFLEQQVELRQHFQMAMACANTTADFLAGRDQLRKEVQCVFNKLYENESKIPLAVMPYQKIQRGEVEVTMSGLPDGVTFAGQKPGDYSGGDLRKILEARGNISCKIVHRTSIPATVSSPGSSAQFTPDAVVSALRASSQDVTSIPATVKKPSSSSTQSEADAVVSALSTNSQDVESTEEILRGLGDGEMEIVIASQEQIIAKEEALKDIVPAEIKIKELQDLAAMRPNKRRRSNPGRKHNGSELNLESRSGQVHMVFHEDGEEKWYYGNIVTSSKTMLKIHFAVDDTIVTIKKRQALELLQEGALKFLG